MGEGVDSVDAEDLAIVEDEEAGMLEGDMDGQPNLVFTSYFLYSFY